MNLRKGPYYFLFRVRAHLARRFFEISSTIYIPRYAAITPQKENVALQARSKQIMTVADARGELQPTKHVHPANAL